MRFVHFELQKKPDWSKKGDEKKVQEAEAWTSTNHYSYS